MSHQDTQCTRHRAYGSRDAGGVLWSSVFAEAPVERAAISSETPARRLTELWETPHSLWDSLATVDHKTIGIRYLVIGVTGARLT